MKKQILRLSSVMFAIFLLSAVPFSLSAAISDSSEVLPPKKAGWSPTDTILKGVAPEDFTANHDMAIQARGSLRMEMPKDGEISSRFRMDNLRWNVQGTFGKKNEFFYHFNQSLNANLGLNSMEGLLSSINYAYVVWKPIQKISLTFGKQVLAIGGHEFWASPINVLQYSDFVGSIACYQLGAKATWHFTPTQELALQMANIRGSWDEDFFYGGLPDGVESTGAPFLYSLNWNGRFLDNTLELRYSASYGQQAKDKSLWTFAMGHSLHKEKWGFYLDLIYSRQDLDENGLISASAVFPDGMARTIENVEYTSVIAYLHLYFTPSFSAFLKGTWECGFLSEPYGQASAGLSRVNWNGQACLEYMPTKNRDFRFFLHYNFYDLSPTDNGMLLGIRNIQDHRISLGLLYILNVF